MKIGENKVERERGGGVDQIPIVKITMCAKGQLVQLHVHPDYLSKKTQNLI